MTLEYHGKASDCRRGYIKMYIPRKHLTISDYLVFIDKKD